MKTFLYLFLSFLFYSSFGYFCEVIHNFFITKKFTWRRGFFLGPYCPIYGLTAMFLLLIFSSIPLASLASFVLVFLLSSIFASCIEYSASFLLEKIFHARWWDYQERKWNLKGRVCLSNSILFGLGGCFLVFLLNPIFTSVLFAIPEKIILALSFVFLILFAFDFFLTLFTIYELDLSKKKLEGQDATEQIQKMLRKMLSKNG